MKFSTAATAAKRKAADALIIPCWKGGKLAVADKALAKAVEAPLKLGDFTGKASEVVVLYEGGERIFLVGLGEKKEFTAETLRRAYACVVGELPPNHDPFESDGVVGDFARKNFLFERKTAAYAPSGFHDLSKNKYKLRFIYFIMRTILRLVGPNRIYNFSRLLVYLSSYRQNRGLWKY